MSKNIPQKFCEKIQKHHCYHKPIKVPQKNCKLIPNEICIDVPIKHSIKVPKHSCHSHPVENCRAYPIKRAKKVRNQCQQSWFFINLCQRSFFSYFIFLRALKSLEAETQKINICLQLSAAPVNKLLQAVAMVHF